MKFYAIESNVENVFVMENGVLCEHNIIGWICKYINGELKCILINLADCQNTVSANECFTSIENYKKQIPIKTWQLSEEHVFPQIGDQEDNISNVWYLEDGEPQERNLDKGEITVKYLRDQEGKMIVDIDGFDRLDNVYISRLALLTHEDIEVLILMGIATPQYLLTTKPS